MEFTILLLFKGFPSIKNHLGRITKSSRRGMNRGKGWSFGHLDEEQNQEKGIKTFTLLSL